MNKKYLLAIAASTLMFAACGDEVTEINEIHQDGMAVLEAGEKLSKQACDTTNVGEMLFVMDSSAAFVCDGKSWQTLKGEKGEDGEKGEKGDKGSKGDSGKDGSDGTSCTAKSVKNKAGLEGLEVTCGGAVVDTIWNGAKGESGNDGVGCSAKDEGDGTVTVSCGEGKTTLYKAMCGTVAYDPAKSFCLEGELYSCNDKPFDPKKQYCLKVTRDEIDIYSVEDLLTDPRDNQVYKTVKIGDQVWMAENLNYSVNPGEQSWCGGGESETTNEGDCSVYGRLYTWAAAVDKSEDECGYGLECDLSGAKNEKGEVRGVCPEGWHSPDSTEWNTLLATVGGQDVAAKMLKSASGWKDDVGSSGDGLDAYGFSAHPAGYKFIGYAYFISAGERANFWSASLLEDDSYNAYYLKLHNNREDADLYIGDKRYGHSVRCLQNN